MQRLDATEASEIADRMLANLAACVPPKGLNGFAARTAIGDARANVLVLIAGDQLGPVLTNIFGLVQQSGATLAQIEFVRQQLDLETPVSLGATLVRTVGIRYCLAAEAGIISTMTFVSRQDVDRIKFSVQQPFQEAEEIAADSMDQATFQALIALHGALVNHLVQTARPLPQVLGFQFAKPMPSLVLAYRLYADASRADEIVMENKIVHPAFCPPTGIALSR